MLFSERRYDFHGAGGPIFRMISMLQPRFKGLDANHPKYRNPSQLRSSLSAYHLSEKNMTSCAKWEIILKPLLNRYVSSALLPLNFTHFI